MEQSIAIKEIATALKVPARTIQYRATKESWPYTEELLPTGAKRRLYQVAALPSETQRALARRAVSTAVAVIPVQPVATLNPLLTKDWQKDALSGRAIVLAEIERMRIEDGIRQSDAIDALVALAQNDELPAWLRDAADKANQRRRKGAPVLSRPTLYRWIKIKNERAINALTPRPAHERTDYPWDKALMRVWSLSSNPSLASCLKRLPALLPPDAPMPSYSQAMRFLDKLPFQIKNKGRIGPKEMRQHLAYVTRDISGIEAGWIYCGDGHTFKAQVAHPAHGRPFRPEITTIIDVATRKVVGWSVALSENTLSVADAMVRACMSSVPAIFYYDNGSGANNKIWDEPATGLISRLGITKMNSIPGNSQSRGVIERFHSSVLHEAAKFLPSYVGKDMDPDARFIQDRLLRADIRKTGASRLLPTWPELIDFLTNLYDIYNDRPHSALPRIIDPASGRQRHMTPNERWNDSVAQGTEIFPLTKEEAIAEFRPTITRKCNRAIIKLFTNEYFALALEPYHQCDVQVSFDVQDGSRIWVADDQGRYICEAIAGGNRQGFAPRSMMDDSNEKRVNGQRKLKLRQIDVIEMGRKPQLIEHQPEIPAALYANAPAMDASIERLAIEMEEKRTKKVVAIPSDPQARYCLAYSLTMRAAAGEALPDDWRQWLQTYQKTAEFKGQAEMHAEFGDLFLAGNDISQRAAG